MHNYEYRVVIIDSMGARATKFYDHSSAFSAYETEKKLNPDAFVNIEMREAW